MEMLWMDFTLGRGKRGIDNCGIGFGMETNFLWNSQLLCCDP